MPSQTLLTIDMITPEALMILENESGFIPNVDRQYEKFFAKPGAKIGETMRIRKPDRVLPKFGAVFQPDAESQQYTTLTIATQIQEAIAFTEAEQVMKLDNFSSLILKPRMSQIASSVDNLIAQQYKSIWNSVGTPGTTPATSQVLLDATRKLDENATPRSDRFCVVDPAANAGLVEGLKGLFNPSSIISTQFKSGLMYEGILGINEIRMSQSIESHLTGSRLTTDPIVVSATVSTQGSTTLSFSGGTGSATIVEGDVFTIAGVFGVNPQTRKSTGSLQQFVCTATSTASGGAWSSVSVQPAMYTADQALATITAFPVASAAVTFRGAASTSYPQNLVYHRNAITLGTVDLEMPFNGKFSRAEHNGLSLRIWQFSDGMQGINGTRLDMLFGTTVVRPETAVRIWG